MSLPGIITNVTAFGAFVDIGVHQDGLVHISQLANRFVKDPADVVAVQQKVRVRVMEVDLERNRISLTMKTVSEARAKKKVCHPERLASRTPTPPARRARRQKEILRFTIRLRRHWGKISSDNSLKHL
jgi:uncharacterized protein